MTVVNIEWPNGGVTDSDVASGAQIQASKLEGEFCATEELFASTTTITALASRMIHTVRGEQGTLLSFEGVIVTQATGADRTVTVDLEKAAAGGSFASILSTTVNITNSTAELTPVAAVFSNTALVDGDTLRAVVTVAGSAGAQALGLHVTLHWREDAS